MDLNLTQAEQLVSQVQTAHRLAVGFYQRILPQLETVAGALDMQFWYWKPAYTSRPCSSATSPNKSWKWDLLPLFASQHAYWRIAGEQAQEGDTALVFNLCIDQDFKPERRKLLGIKGQPDPLAMKGVATAEIFLIRCFADSEQPFHRLWEEITWPEDAGEGWQIASPTMNVCRLTYSLAQFIAEPQSIIGKLKGFLG